SAGRSIRIGRPTLDRPQYDLGVTDRVVHSIQFVRASAPLLGKFLLEGVPEHALWRIVLVDLLAKRIQLCIGRRRSFGDLFQFSPDDRMPRQAAGANLQQFVGMEGYGTALAAQMPIFFQMRCCHGFAPLGDFLGEWPPEILVEWPAVV